MTQAEATHVDAVETEEQQVARWAAERERTIAAAIARTNEALYPQATEIDGALFRLLLGCAHRVGIEVTARVDVGPTLMGLAVLQLLAPPKPMVTISELAAGLGCTQAAVTQTLNRLEKQGLIKRSRDGWDARGKLIHLTPHALKVWDTANAPICSVMRGGTKSFTAAQKEQLVELLERMESNLDDVRWARAWNDPEPTRLEAAPVAETSGDERALRARERRRRSAVHVR